MIIAKTRVSSDTGKYMKNLHFSSMESAKAWSIENIGKKTNDSEIVEFISITDYETMETEQYEMEEENND
jgi:hypothetical protein